MVIKPNVEFVENMADALPDITRPHEVGIHASGWVSISYLDDEGGVRHYPPQAFRFIDFITQETEVSE